MFRKFLFTLLSLIILRLACIAEQNDRNDSDVINCLECYGWYIGKQCELQELGLNEQESKALCKGIEKALSDYHYPATQLQELLPKTETLIREKTTFYSQTKAKQNEAIAMKNKTEAIDFYEQLSHQPNIKSTPSGLFYEVLRQGMAQVPETNSTVRVHYEGRLIDGTVFDSSYERKEPAVFALKAVIAGFAEGLMLVGKQGKIRLYIPPELGYGNRDLPNIPAGSTLIFDIELLDINPKD